MEKKPHKIVGLQSIWQNFELTIQFIFQQKNEKKKAESRTRNKEKQQRRR